MSEILTREEYASALAQVFRDGALLGHGTGNHELLMAHDAALRADYKELYDEMLVVLKERKMLSDALDQAVATVKGFTPMRRRDYDVPDVLTVPHGFRTIPARTTEMIPNEPVSESEKADIEHWKSRFQPR